MTAGSAAPARTRGAAAAGTIPTVVAVVVAVVVGVGLLVGVQAATAPAAVAAERCQPGRGVTVVVDFGPLGGTALGCDPDGGNAPATEVMRDAGFTVVYAAGQPFVCRIDGRPTPDQETCAQTPPADAYWGLFSSRSGSGWSYADVGIGGLRVPQGGSIGWRFQNGGPVEQPGPPPTAPGSSPSPSPSPDPAPAPDPEPTRPPSPQPDPGPGGGSGGSGGSGGAGGSGGSGGSPSATPTASPSATPTASASPTATADERRERRERRERSERRQRAEQSAPADPPSPTDSPEDAGETPATTGGDDLTETGDTLAPLSSDTDTDSGGSGLLWATGVLLLVLGAAAGLLAWRRRA